MFWHIADEETLHETEADAPYRCYAFQLVGYGDSRPVPHISFLQSMEKIEEFCQECLKAFHSNEIGREYLADYVYYTFRYRAATSSESAVLCPQAPAVPYPKALSNALRFIEKNIQREPLIDDIARHAEISKPHLFALFRQYLHCSPHKYMLVMRINRARALLCSGNLPIKQIASLCHFNSLEVFFRQFRKCTGMTPAEYRIKNR